MNRPATSCPLCGEPRSAFDCATWKTESGDYRIEACAWCGTRFFSENLDQGFTTSPKAQPPVVLAEVEEENQQARALATSLHGDPNNPWHTGSPAWVDFSRRFHKEHSFYPQDAGDMQCWRWYEAGTKLKEDQTNDAN